MLDQFTDNPKRQPEAARPHCDEPVLGRLGGLTVKLAETPAEIEAAKRLRYAVFHEERGKTGAAGANAELDEDAFDAHCDHLIVVDEKAGTESKSRPVIATYRLMNRKMAERAGRFYSAAEYDIASLLKRHKDLSFLEFGRSCVAPGYRDKRTVELLWHGSWAYVRRHGHDVMFGCASFEGTDPAVHAEALSLLGEQALAEDEWQVSAVAPSVSLPILAPEAYQARRALRSLPPILKGYLRLGAIFAREAVIDHAFGTVDVLVLLPVARLNPRYVRYYGADAGRHKAD
ncbi:GNAT family N-acetyltransferase [Salaquimonas pukyongi]|uniref:GNAT family N-acetyltransferase n=1 Tax=Salaquimonas pukyongi TaxID=2712698 RepID=UPI00096B6C61|nr:GNAT family N-acyltransferase [Salaquimonas pukyongi]